MDAFSTRHRIVIEDLSSSSDEETTDLLNSSPEASKPDTGTWNHNHRKIIIEDSSDSEQENENDGDCIFKPKNYRNQQIIIDDSSDSEEENIDQSNGLPHSSASSKSGSSDYYNGVEASELNNVDALSRIMAQNLKLSSEDPNANRPIEEADLIENGMRSLRFSDASMSTKGSNQSTQGSIYFTPSSVVNVHSDTISVSGMDASPVSTRPSFNGSSSSKSERNMESLDDEFGDCAWSYDRREQAYVLSADNYEINGVTWPELCVPSSLYDRLYSHQKVGVQWMASLHSSGIGGILGDDMGLGKTFQTLTYLGGLMKSQSIRNALIVAPLSVLQSWEKEAHDIIKNHCAPRVNVVVISSDISKRRRINLLLDAQECSPRSPYLVITTYGLIRSSPLDFASSENEGRPCWDYVVCDEGHLIKNPSAQISKSCRRICRDESTRRLLLTGTPIQNNLKEMWALFDWATSGKVLGRLKRFENHFAAPIEEGRNKNATEWMMNVAEKRGNELQELIRPHFIQRLKKTTFGDELPTKCELVVWTHLSTTQRDMYKNYVDGNKVASVLRGEVSSPLESITWLKKLCGHPLLVERQGEELNASAESSEHLKKRSAKLEVLVALINRLRKSGHRTLIFSQSTRMLDIIAKALEHVQMFRIDGSTKQKDRQARVDGFNSKSSTIEAMLLSTKAAGLGLTLTGADRAIIYDPSWNPAEDSQAVDRCYRIGQMRDVTVYRLITAGTVEGKMYEKQVHKDGIRRAIMTASGIATERFFDKKDLKKLFRLAPIGECALLERTQSEDQVAATGSSGKQSFLENHQGVVGVSSHDGIYSRSVIDIQDETAVSQTPFGGTTPARNKKLGALVSKTALDFDDEFVQEVNKPARRKHGRAQRALSKQEIVISDDEAVQHVTVDIASPRPSSKDRKENVAPNKQTSPLLKQQLDDSSRKEQDNLMLLFSKADDLRRKGDLRDAMVVLLDIFEGHPLAGKEKLEVHRRVAFLARELELTENLAWFPI